MFGLTGVIFSPATTMLARRKSRIWASALLLSCFTISSPLAFDLRDSGDAIHCAGHSCLEALSAMELRLLVGGVPCADHGHVQGVTVQIEVLERTPALRHPPFPSPSGLPRRAHSISPHPLA